LIYYNQNEKQYHPLLDLFEIVETYEARLRGEVRRFNDGLDSLEEDNDD
tara:strand:- start:405 stop:551 length:147 start_codon:yes stop_codon:yes gene_type:complete